MWCYICDGVRCAGVMCDGVRCDHKTAVVCVCVWKMKSSVRQRHNVSGMEGFSKAKDGRFSVWK